MVVDNLVRFPFGPSERSGKPTEVSRRLFAYFLVGEKVCPRRDDTGETPGRDDMGGSAGCGGADGEKW